MSQEVTINQGITGTITTNNYDYNKRIQELTPEEKTKMLAIGSVIDVTDVNTIQNYGSDLTQVISSNGNTLLKAVRADNSSEVVALTNELLAQLDLIDVDELNQQTKWKRFVRGLPLVGKMVTSVQAIMNKYDNISDNVEKISKKIDSAKIVAMRDNTTLQQIFDSNTQYIDQIRELILAAKVKDKEISDKIADMQMHPDQYELYEIQDMQTFQNTLQKRIADMETSEYVLTQNLYQIRATQGNNVAIANKSDNIVNNIIPLWKNQLAISIIINNQQASIDAQQKIADTTNKILRKNADNLKMNSINVAKANEEQVISLDTLRETTNSLIETVKEVKKIHDEGAKHRAEIEVALQSFTSQLENTINDLNNN